MNEQLQQALAVLLAKATDGVGFLQAELPEVIQQLLVWKMAQAGLTMVLALAWLSASAYILRVSKGRLTEIEFVTLIGAGLGSVFAAAQLIKAAFKLLQIWLAPKVYLVEYAASLAR